MPSSRWQGVRRLLAVRLDNRGDVIMLGPALRALRRGLPEANITLLASPAGAEVAPLLPWVDDVLVHRAAWQDASDAMPLDPGREFALIDALRAGRFDAAIVFTSFAQTPYPAAYACYLAGIPLRLGHARLFGGSVLSDRAGPLPDFVHQVDRNLHLVAAAGFGPAGRHLELHVPPDAQAGADRLLREAGIDPAAPFLVLAPGASFPARRYDARFAEVARRLAAQTGLPLAVTGSPREAPTLEPVLDAVRGRAVADLVGRTTVPGVIAVIRRARLLLANDSGPMHMADAFGRPTVILFSGTDLESQWAPRSAPARLLRRRTPCAPCYRFHCPYQMECLDLSPAEVVEEVLDLLRRTESKTEERRRKTEEKTEQDRSGCFFPSSVFALPSSKEGGRS
jgi:ADP-heptose:LPS heptosyltransferase